MLGRPRNGSFTRSYQRSNAHVYHQSQKRRKQASKTARLIDIADRAGSLVYESTQSTQLYWLAGGMNRLIEFPFSELEEREISAFAESHIRFALKEGDPFLHPSGFYMLQLARADGAGGRCYISV